MPAAGALDLRGIEDEVSAEVLESLLEIDADDWRAELASQHEFFAKFGSRMPDEIWSQLEALGERMGLSNNQIASSGQTSHGRSRS